MRISDLKKLLIGRDAHIVNIATIPTSAGNNYAYTSAPFKGRLIAAIFAATDALAANDTNRITFGLVNLGQDGTGTAAMLAETNANSTRATGGSALAANTRRNLVLHDTPANLQVNPGDRLRFAPVGAGTLGNSVGGGVLTLIFERSNAS